MAITDSFAQDYQLLENQIKNGLDRLYNEKKIRKEEYAEIYATLIKGLAETALKLPIMEKDLEVKEAQLAQEQERINLIREQIQGFKDNIKIKLFNSSMNAWAMMFNSGFLLDDNDNPLIPDFVTNDKTTCLWNELINSANADSSCRTS